MQKNTKFTLKKLTSRIFPLTCFILALVISPIVFMHTENMPVPTVQNQAPVSEVIDTNEVQEQVKDDDTTSSENAAEQTDATSEAGEQEQQSEVETVSPPLSESYMLRELFSDIEFSEKAESEKPSTITQQPPTVTTPTKPQTPVTVTPPAPVTPPVTSAPTEQTQPEDKTPEVEPVPETQTPPVENTPETIPGTDVTPVTPEATDTPSDSQPENVTVNVPVIEPENADTGNENSAETDATVSAPPLNDGTSTRGSITTVRVLDHLTGGVLVMDLDEYIASVIVAEMPSYAGDEALKAQAVACRTFVVHRAVVSATHSGANVCTNPGHCQAFMSKSRFRAKYGAAGTDFYNRAYNAAKSTSGIIAVYDGTPITAAFHASSGGSTMSSADVWGGSLPYLVPVYSPEQDDPEMRELISAHKSFSKEVFIRYLAAAGYSGASAYYDQGFDSFVGPITHTNSGKVGSVSIAGENVSGQTMKNIFGLRSTCFSISYNANNITFVCLGYGHGVGMSQLGACTMAKQGSSYAEILTHYYTGVDLVIW